MTFAMKAEVLPPGNALVPEPPAVYGLVLMGGQSTRMGQDKSALNYHGKPQREYLTELLSSCCQAVYWSVNETQFSLLAYNHMLLDAYPETGPLGGLLTAFDLYPTVAWLIVPCDLPRLDLNTLQTLVNKRNPSMLAIAFWQADHTGAEPLVSLWEPAAGPVLRTWFRAGNRSPRQFLSTHAVTMVDAPDSSVFDNVNDWQGYLSVKGEMHKPD